MTDFKGLKQVMYCTPMDVRGLYSVFEREVESDDDIVTTEQQLTDARIEQHINNADALILGYLIGPYGESALSAETPYMSVPVTPRDNPSTVSLRGVIVASTAITEQWFVKFTGTNVFTVVGTASGTQGSGTISLDFTSTNSDIQIKSEDWDLGVDSAVDEGNQVIFSTYTSHKLVRTLSARLACADLISAFYQTVKGEDPEYARQLRRYTMDFLKALVDPNTDVSLNAIRFDDIQPEAVAWDIDKYGSDVTEYGSYTDDHKPMDL